MKAKRFTAPTMKKALELVSQELGKEAVILSNKKVEGGVEVVAALDYQTHAEDIAQEKIVQQESANPQKQEVERQLALQQELENAKKTTAEIRRETSDRNLERARQEEITRKQALVSKSNLNELSEIKNVLTQLQQDLEVDHSEQKNIEPIKVDRPKKQRVKPTSTDVFSIADEQPETVSSISKSHQASNSQSISNSAPLEVKQTEIKTGAHTHAENQQDEKLLNQVTNELSELKNWLVSQQGDAWNPKRPLTWQQAQIWQRCQDLGIDPIWADELVAGLKQDDAIEKLWNMCLLKMSRELPIAKDNILDKAGIYALVGPTGAGKTTTIGKLAAQYVVKHGAEKVALVTLDNYRIAAHEQLKSFARLMGVGLHVLPPEGDLGQLLHKLRDKQFILIDTAGLSSQDPHFSVQLSMLKSAGHRISNLLTLPLTSQARCLQENYEHFYQVGLDGCLFTKLDECFSLGQALSVAAITKLPISMVADGPHIPDDLHFPDAKKLVRLAEQMARLAQKRWQATASKQMAASRPKQQTKKATVN